MARKKRKPIITWKILDKYLSKVYEFGYSIYLILFVVVMFAFIKISVTELNFLPTLSLFSVTIGSFSFLAGTYYKTLDNSVFKKEAQELIKSARDLILSGLMFMAFYISMILGLSTENTTELIGIWLILVFNLVSIVFGSILFAGGSARLIHILNILIKD